MSYDWNVPTEKVVKPYCKRLPKPDTSLWEEMKHYLWDRNLDFATAQRNLWYPSRDAGDDVPRVVIPASSRIPGNLFWQARAMGHSDKRYQSPHASRGDSIIVVHPAQRPQQHGRSVVVEGPFDALAAAAEGYLAVALMGINPPEPSIWLTYEVTRGKMVLCLADADQPGAMLKLMQQLTTYGATCQLRTTAPDKDLADANRTRRLEILT